VVIRFGSLSVYPGESSSEILNQLKAIMAAEKVSIHVSLNIGQVSATVWGCSLSEGYVKINSEYST
jgi:glutamate N-acetyltransferase/amino-acid N-acetyltransferase